MSCKWCAGTGVIPAGYNYLAHDCPDCEGTGEEIVIKDCTECGEEFRAESEEDITCQTCIEKEEKEDEG